MAELKRYRSVVADSARWDGFAFRPGDIVISTPPKCGTTWMQRLVALLVFDDVELYAPVSHISPWLDMQLAPLEQVVARLESQQHRRFIKTHTPLDGVPDDERVTYVCVGRDPRDVAVSSAHHMANMDGERFMQVRQSAVGLADLAELGLDQPGPSAPRSPDEQLRSWIEDDSDVTPMSLGYVLRHLSTCWDRRNRPNVALFHYDDLRDDLAGQMRRLAEALGIEVTDGRISELAAAATFDAMRSHAADVAPNTDISLWHDNAQFFHRGTSGQWRDVFSHDDMRAYQQRVAELTSPDLAAWLHHGSDIAAVTGTSVRD
jgi:hypothetical protein